MSDVPALARARPPEPLHPALTTAPTASRFILRGPPAVMSAAASALGLAWSGEACRAASNPGAAALWLGPDETLLLLPEGGDLTAPAQLAADLDGLSYALVDVSHRQAGLHVSGPDAEALLATGCPLDLHLTRFPVGMCTRTVFAKCEILLWRTAPDQFHLEVWRSFRAYVLGLLEQAGEEFPG